MTIERLLENHPMFLPQNDFSTFSTYFMYKIKYHK